MFPIALRLSQWKLHDYKAMIARSPMELETLLAPLADAGVDIFDCSQRSFSQPEFAGSRLNLAGWTKKLTGKHTITVGSIGLDRERDASREGQISNPADIDPLLDMIERGEVDLAAVGRALIGDPCWVRRIEEGTTLDERPPYDPEALKRLT